MRLIEINPRWIASAERKPRRIGLSFDCPHCRTQRLAVLFGPSYVEYLPDGHTVARGWNSEHIWAMVGNDFDDISLSPSIDTGASGHWHGFISNGEVV